MFASRTRLRVQAALATGLLLLTGAGEVLGACYCEHRGGPGATQHGEHRDAADAHAADERHAGTEDDASGPAGEGCRAACALACAVNPNPTPDVWERVPDLLSSALVSAPRPAEPTDIVPVIARPHFLPFSQAPPTTA